MIDVSKYLPVGSVVLLRGGIKKVVIMGILQIRESEGKQEVWDYIGVTYPEGLLSAEAMVLFNHDNINDVVFTGYHNPEREEFLVELEKNLRQAMDETSQEAE